MVPLKFEFLKDIALADIAFAAYGKDLPELFQNTAAALLDVGVDPKTLKLTATRKVEIESETVEGLLYDFLSELVFLKDSESFLTKKVLPQVKRKNGKYLLRATLKGEIINPQKHRLRLDVKAVTKHFFRITKGDSGYQATVVLDI